MSLFVGFTGTQLGMTGIQKDRVRRFLKERQPDEVFHGGCIGADKDFHDLVREVLPGCKITVYPSNIKSKVAKLSGEYTRHPPIDPLTRNRWIAAMCDVLVVCPKGRTEENRSGTWFTVRRARERERPIIIYYPH